MGNAHLVPECPTTTPVRPPATIAFAPLSLPASAPVGEHPSARATHHSRLWWRHIKKSSRVRRPGHGVVHPARTVSFARRRRGTAPCRRGRAGGTLRLAEGQL